MNTEPHVNVRVTHRFNTSPERVFDAWLDPEMIGRWMSSSLLRSRSEITCTIFEDCV